MSVFSKVLGDALPADQLFMLSEFKTYLTQGDKIMGVMYLDVPLDTAYERVKFRNWPADKLLTKEHLSAIEEHYATWLDEVPWPVLRLDARKPINGEDAIRKLWELRK